MTFLETVRTAVGNTFRSKLRTVLTILAIFVGAFTLTVTNGAGTGISNYIDDQVASLGASDSMTVTRSADSADSGDGPAAYDPDAKVVGGQQPGVSVIALTQADLDAIGATAGVTGVTPTVAVSPDYVEWDGNGKFQLALAPFTNPDPLLDAGSAIDEDSTDRQLLLPADYVDSLGFPDAEAAVGAIVTIGITDAAGASHTVEAHVAGVSSPTLLASGVTISSELKNDLYDLQSVGLPVTAEKTWSSATATVAADSLDADIADVQEELTVQGFSAVTLADQLGTFKTVINAIVLVLNAFAVIALIAAAFGIINTLLMSVQERTREIGLMKAMGMGGGKIFTLFSVEAVFIGFLGSAIGSGVGIGTGTVLSSVLANGPLSGLAGLQILSFAPASVAGVILLVMTIAFLAGTLPAWRAARQDPIESLRYE